MGKKKIDIELIENKAQRRITFKMRLKGLLKKIQDLTVLSGTKTSLVMTDVDQNIICYSNNDDIQLVVKSTFNQGMKDFGVKAYTPEDVKLFFGVFFVSNLIFFQYPFINKEPSYEFASFTELLLIKNVNYRDWAKLDGFENINFNSQEAINETTNNQTNGTQDGILGKRKYPYIESEKDEIKQTINIDLSIPKIEETQILTGINLQERYLKLSNMMQEEEMKTGRAKRALSVEGDAQKFLKTANRVFNQKPNFNIFNVTNQGGVASPPAEEEEGTQVAYNNFDNFNGKNTLVKITDEMIEKYQKMDTILTFYHSQVNLFTFFVIN